MLRFSRTPAKGVRYFPARETWKLEELKVTKFSANLQKSFRKPMKTTLPWLLVAVTAGGAMFFYNGNQTRSAEVARLQAQVQEVETLRTEIEELKKSQVPAEELARIKESKEELLRLRNQVRQLTADKAQLSQQAQAAKSAAEQARVQAAAAQAQELATKTLADRQGAILAARQAMANDQAVVDASCSNQLRIIAEIKQRWALDHQKSANATPSEKDIAAYILGEVMPTCPGGGKYTVGSLDVSPTCSVAGHVLPPPAQ